MKMFAASFLLLLCTIPCFAIKKIACIGASITYGHGIDQRERNSFPAQLQQLLGSGYEVANYGVSGTTLLRKGDRPYWNTPQYQAALASLPDIVVIDLGGNDSKLVNRVQVADLEQDYAAFIQSFRQLSSRPRIVLLLAIPSFLTDTSQINDRVIVKEINPRIQRVAFAEQVEVLDMHSLFVDQASLMPDKIHPTAIGATIFAKRLQELITAERDLQFDVFSHLPEQRKISSFHGYPCADFSYARRGCKVVKPKWTARNKPWVWRARFWGHEPQADIALLERGFHIVYCDVAELLGNTEAINTWNSFYDLLTKAGLARRTILEGMSRGGVYAFNWAAANPKRVAGVYVDNPVLDLTSWPGGLGRYAAWPKEKELFKADYGLKSDEEMKAFKGSPIDKVKQIVKGHYPIFILCADADEAVAPEENTILFEQKVKAVKGDITVIYKPGAKHHPHSLPNPTPIVDFILKAAKGIR
ncbi:GDSL-type esterase/lipase family protein [Paraflavitalea sp. CAU 1676]|uniref:GDSL-type esterase/lipase family protein n=1 Tax=Paraflavitalea sp. CAU 1676 TaxID=3032598 RepID=UPI0023DC1959|nr:GDSL-type esterase/lipase family protein [Paraflavitalea sp. CAU 1676]MDF2193564.1 GDSL-type esterase/lipase family protein [Paraflavitalea sp. CAU 1676]